MQADELKRLSGKVGPWQRDIVMPLRAARRRLAAGENLPIAERANFSGAMLEHDIAEGNLTVARERDRAIPLHGKNRGGFGANERIVVVLRVHRFGGPLNVAARKFPERTTRAGTRWLPAVSISLTKMANVGVSA